MDTATQVKEHRQELKRFYCLTKNLCNFKYEFIPNQRCFAPYTIRISCRYLKRRDGRSWEQGSGEDNAYQGRDTDD